MSTALNELPARLPVGLTPQSRPRLVDPQLDVVRLLAILRREGHVTRADCAWATARAKAVGVSPAHVLLTWAKVNRLQLWDAQCELWRIPWVDVRVNKPDPHLASAAGLETCLANGWVPHHINGDALVVATSVPPTGEGAARALTAVAAVIEGAVRVEWIGCSDLDIDHMLLTACRDEGLAILAEQPDGTRLTFCQTFASTLKSKVPFTLTWHDYRKIARFQPCLFVVTSGYGI